MYSQSKYRLPSFTSKYKCLSTHGEHAECFNSFCVALQCTYIPGHMMQDTYQLKEILLMSQLGRESGTNEMNQILWQVYMVPQIKIKQETNFLLWIAIQHNAMTAYTAHIGKCYQVAFCVREYANQIHCCMVDQQLRFVHIVK